MQLSARSGISGFDIRETSHLQYKSRLGTLLDKLS